MSIKDHQDEEIVSLPGFWDVLAKFAFAASVPVLLLGSSWAVWVTSMTFNNSARIQVLEYVNQHSGGKSGNQTTSVNVGSSDSVASEIDKAAEHRGYYLTSEAAKILRKSERSITSMCASGLIPDAVQPEGGRGWRIPLGFLLGVGRADDLTNPQPLTSADSGKQRQDLP
mgnify:CR=1 FL=1